MKLLFLDIDGVLNSEMWFRYNAYEIDKPYPICEFDTSAVQRLNEILAKTDAHLVISSSWRLDNELKEIFIKVGITADFDVTPYLPFKTRGDEIKEYMKDKEVEIYCILDDDDSMLEEQKPYFVHCNFCYGLTDEKKNKAIKILNNNGN